VTFGPTFPAAAFEIERRQVLARLRALPDNMFENTWRLFHETLYGSHPYGNHALGRVADVERLTPADLAAFHAEGFDPARMVLALVGDLNPDTALAEIERQFGGHRPPAAARGPAAHSFPAPTPPAACRRAHDRRWKAQAMVCLGWLGPGIGHPDYVPMKVLSAICGGGMGARLFQKVRNQAGLAYMAQAVFPTRLAGGPFCAIIGTDPGAVGRVCDLVLAEIDDLTSSGPTEEERERAVAYLGGQFALDHAASLRQAHFLAWFEWLGVGFGYDRLYPDLLRAVTTADLQRAARTWLTPERAVLAVTGPDQATPRGSST
jgi:zinc protease